MNKVYGVALSPFARKVMLALELKAVDYQTEMVVPYQVPESYYKIHPLGKVPAFSDDYVTLPESSVICAYIEQKYADKTPLYPRDFREAAQAKWLECYADQHLAPVFLMFFFERFVKPKLLGGKTDEAYLEQLQNNKVPSLLSYLETLVPEQGFLFSEGLLVADIAIATVFISSEYGGYQLPEKTYPKTFGYLQRIKQHPVVKARLLEEQEMLASLQA